MTSHSAGPWRRGDDCFVFSGSGNVVSDFVWGNEEDWENGHLIASAPDLLAALQMVLSHPMTQLSPVTRGAVQAAIAKARGN
jgi:hypothetical protein